MAEETSLAPMIAVIEEKRPELLLGVDVALLDAAGVAALMAQALAPQPGLELVTGSLMPGPEPVRDVDLDALVQHHGLVYRDHVQREQKQADGTVRKIWLSTERALTGGDVQNHRFDGEDVIVVTRDGQKWRFTPDGLARNLMEV